MRPVVRSFYDLPNIPTFFGRMSFPGREPGVTGALCDQSYGLVTITLTWIPVYIYIYT